MLANYTTERYLFSYGWDGKFQKAFYIRKFDRTARDVDNRYPMVAEKHRIQEVDELVKIARNLGCEIPEEKQTELQKEKDKDVTAYR